ncbi:hypothetical protein FJO69_00655 [[Mycoplasma] falconis]|uniref:Uncharacterized protein n=1 Tax=[Mycoplasma] falconis TaxID=92403 RepID=A0A501XCL2_9BACT|nr:hypothetical protein [[Mycoplasma] falconis]TPE58103.1 hypothetical protein FJO69_00655 [[Mycoplasma] falconis]
MKDIIRKNQKIWVVFIALNFAALMMYTAFAYLRYDLVLGDLVGIISFALLIGFVLLCFKLFAKPQANKKKSRLNTFFIILIFLVLLIINLGIFALFFYINKLYNRSYPSSNIAFEPFNFLAVMTPYVILSLMSIVIAFANIKKAKRSLQK